MLDFLEFCEGRQKSGIWARARGAGKSAHSCAEVSGRACEITRGRPRVSGRASRTEICNRKVGDRASKTVMWNPYVNGRASQIGM